jgi:hypothetical protein
MENKTNWMQALEWHLRWRLSIVQGHQLVVNIWDQLSIAEEWLLLRDSETSAWGPHWRDFPAVLGDDCCEQEAESWLPGVLQGLRRPSQ